MPTVYTSTGAPMPTRESAHGNRHLYTGREWDPQLVMYHYRHRTDETKDSRFLQSD